MMPLRQYLTHPFNSHARYRNEQGNFQRAQREEEMGEATLRANIPDADFEEPKSLRPTTNPMQQRAPYEGRHAHGKETTNHSHTASTTEGDFSNPPILVDQGATWARQNAEDDVFWNSTLVEGTLPPRYGGDRDAPGYPYEMSRQRKSTPELIGQPPKRLTTVQQAELERLRAIENQVLGAKEKEALSKAAQEKHKAIGGKRRVVVADVPQTPGADDEPQDYFARHGHPQQDPHVGIVQLPSHICPAPNLGHPTANDRAVPSSSRPIFTESAELPQTPALSMEFDPCIRFPTDESILIYKNSQGQRRMVIPHHQHPSLREEPLQRPHEPTEPSPQESHSEALRAIGEVPTHSASWNAALRDILNYESVDPKTVERVRQRALHSTMTNGGRGTHNVSAVDVGLVPNFSRPSVAAEWNDRWYAEGRFQSQDREWIERAYQPPLSSTSSSVQSMLHHAKDTASENIEPEKKEVDEQLPNGKIFSRQSSRNSSSSSRRHSGPTHVRPSGLATDEEVRAYRRKNSPSPAASPETRLRMQEKTLATQDKLIRKLHRQVDRLRRRKDYYEEELIPELSKTLQTVKTWIEAYNDTVTGLELENDELWTLADFSRKVLRLCWRREGEIRKLVDEIRDRKAQRGLVKRLFRVKNKTHAQSSKGSARKRSRIWPKTTRRSRIASVEPSIESSSAGSGLNDQCSAGGDAPLPSRASSTRSSVEDTASRPGRTRMSNMAVVFSSSKSDLETLARIAAQNMKILCEDVNDWADLEQRCLDLREGRDVMDVRDV